MGLFKRKEKASGIINPEAKIKVLGSGCAKCEQVEQNTQTALKSLGRDETVGHIFDIAKIAEYGVMATPAIIINDKVVASGKVFSPDEIVELIKAND